MSRSRSDAWPVLPRGGWAVLLLALVGGVAVACDGGGAKRASQYQRLTGTWTPDRLLVNGVDLTGQIDSKAVHLTFRGGTDERRTYRLRAIHAGDTLQVDGPVAVPRTNILNMQGGFSRPVIWTFRFGELSSSVEFRNARGEQVGMRPFLQALLPGQEWGRNPRVQLDLLRE